MEEKLGSSSATTSTTAGGRSTKVCVYYNTPRGCAYGERCRYRHVLNNDGHSTRTQQQQQHVHKQHKHEQHKHIQHKHEQQQKSSKNTRSNQPYRPGGRQQRDRTISNERAKVSGGCLQEGDEQRDTALHREDNRFSASTSHGSTSRPPQSLVQPSSSLSSNRSLERIKEDGIAEKDHEDGEMSHLHSLLQFPQIGSQSTQQYHHHYQQHRGSRDGMNLSSGPTVPSTSNTRQCEAANSRSRGNNPAREQPRHGPSSEFSLGDLLLHSTTATTRQPVARPTAEKSDDLFSTEIQQMKLRFSDSNLELLEKSSVQHVYKIMFEPTDPDWPFSFGVLVLKVTFPTSYPRELCTVVLAEDGEKILPQHCSKSINDAVKEELKRLSQSLGKNALIFRPFLKWFDRNIVQLIQMSCSPKDLESLLPVRKTQLGNFSSDGKCPDDDERNSFDESGDESDDDHPSNDHHDNSNEAQLVSTCEGTVKRGTEVKVKNLALTPEVGVVQCTEMKVVLLCGRCKESVDVRVKPLKVVYLTCPRCHLSISVHYRPSTVHLENTTLGFLDVDSCIVYDVVMFGSEVTVSCMTCGKNTCTKGLHYGQPHLLWCQHCHQKMMVTMETCRLMQHAPLDHPAQMLRPSESVKGREKKPKEVEIREGHPLPGHGTCEHYKKSFRWLRFPCCGKAFPCDLCHDTKEDHPYELANRMICGHCAKEQAYTSGKPCSACKSLLTSTASTGFWEGGQGCRNKLKMNRNEKKKYSNSTSKTSSLKKDRVGLKGKMKALHV